MNKIVLDYKDNEDLSSLVAGLKDGEKVTISGVEAQVIKNANEEIELRVVSIDTVDAVLDEEGDSDDEDTGEPADAVALDIFGEEEDDEEEVPEKDK